VKVDGREGDALGGAGVVALSPFSASSSHGSVLGLSSRYARCSRAACGRGARHFCYFWRRALASLSPRRCDAAFPFQTSGFLFWRRAAARARRLFAAAAKDLRAFRRLPYQRPPLRRVAATGRPLVVGRAGVLPSRLLVAFQRLSAARCGRAHAEDEEGGERREGRRADANGSCALLSANALTSAGMLT